MEEDGNTPEGADHQKEGIVGTIMEQFRANLKKQEEQEAQAEFSNADMMAGLQDLVDESPEAA